MENSKENEKTNTYKEEKVSETKTIYSYMPEQSNEKTGNVLPTSNVIKPKKKVSNLKMGTAIALGAVYILLGNWAHEQEETVGNSEFVEFLIKVTPPFSSGSDSTSDSEFKKSLEDWVESVGKGIEAVGNEVDIFFDEIPPLTIMKKL